MARFLPIAVAFLVVLVAGCGEQPKKKEAWEKREQVYTDKTPEQWLKLIRHRDTRVRMKAADAVVGYGKKCVPSLIEIAADKGAGKSRMAAAQALGRIGADAQSAVPALAKALKETAWPERDVAADALGNIGQKLDVAIPALAEALRSDQDERVRMTAARALGRLRTGESAAVSALAGALEDSDGNVRAEAAEALQKIGPAAKAALPALEKAAKVEDFIVAQAAQEALKTVRGQ